MAPMTRDIRLAAEQLYPNYGHISYRPNIEICKLIISRQLSTFSNLLIIFLFNLYEKDKEKLIYFLIFLNIIVQLLIKF